MVQFGTRQVPQRGPKAVGPFVAYNNHTLTLKE